MVGVMNQPNGKAISWTGQGAKQQSHFSAALSPLMVGQQQQNGDGAAHGDGGPTAKYAYVHGVQY